MGLDLGEPVEEIHVVAVVTVGCRRPAERVARPAARVELGEERAGGDAEALDGALRLCVLRDPRILGEGDDGLQLRAYRFELNLP